MTVDYDALVKNYYEGLFNKLRNFTPGPEFLDTWVHDENHERSIYGIFEAAESAKLPSLSLTVNKAILATLNVPSLKQDLSRLGVVTLSEKEEQTQFNMEFKHE